MICLWNAGMQDELFYLVYKLNEHAKITYIHTYIHLIVANINLIVAYPSMKTSLSC